jgi:hypothetical protein
MRVVPSHLGHNEASHGAGRAMQGARRPRRQTQQTGGRHSGHGRQLRLMPMSRLPEVYFSDAIKAPLNVIDSPSPPRPSSLPRTIGVLFASKTRGIATSLVLKLRGREACRHHERLIVIGAAVDMIG